MQSMPIRTKAVRSNHDHGEVYLIQHYAIKFVSDLRQVGGFLAPSEVFLIKLQIIKCVSDIYHIEIEIKDGTDRAESASYLDLQL